MLEYTETMTLLEEMKPHYDDGFTSSERGVIENLYNKVCGKPIRRGGCSDCYRDAYIEVVTTLKRLGTMPITPNYTLKAGVVLHEFGSADFYTLNNIPDDFAERWLVTHPADVILFERMPSDWGAKVEKKKKEMGLIHSDESTDSDKVDKEAEKSIQEADVVAADSEEKEKQSARRGRQPNK